MTTARSETALRSLAGQALGAYRVLSVLGEGGMGQVYLAEHEVIGRKAAIKVLSEEVAGYPEVVSRFFTEARAANEIRHPNIVEVTDFGTTGGLPYIVMEYLEGETLGDRLARAGMLAEPAALTIAAQVASALTAAHERGLVHRDLKPANIFLLGHPDYPDFVKVLDFGIAKLLGEGGAAHHTQVGALLGTPAYMSPEQCMGDLSLDHRSDIYSLGVVLYQMLTGRTPFDGTLGRLVLGHTQETPAPPETVNPRISAAASALVMRALEKSPARRFPGMREMRAALTVAPNSPRRDPAPSTPAREPATVFERGTAVIPAVPAVAAAPTPTTSGATVAAHGAITGTSATFANRLAEIMRARVEAEALELPGLSRIAARCLDLAAGAGFSFGGMAALLAQEPRLAAHVAECAARETAPGRVIARGIEGAVARLGAEGVRIAVIEAAVKPALVGLAPRIEDTYRRPWARALAVAHVARVLARGRLGPDGAGDAYAAGLVRDAGRPLLAAFVVDIERQVVGLKNRRLLSEDGLVACVEAMQARVAATLARRLGLAEPIAAAVEKSHGHDAQAGASLARVLALSAALAARAGFSLRLTETIAAASAIERGCAIVGIDARAADAATTGLHELVKRRS